MVDAGFTDCACGAAGSEVRIEDLLGREFKPAISRRRNEDGDLIEISGDEQVRLKCPACGHSQISYYPQRFKLWRIHQDVREGKVGHGTDGTV